MFANDLPTRRTGERNGIMLRSQDDIRITLSCCDENKYWLQVKSHSIHASTRSSVNIFDDNRYLIIRYLETVCGVVRFLEESDLNPTDRQESLERAIKVMASVDYLKCIH